MEPRQVGQQPPGFLRVYARIMETKRFVIEEGILRSISLGRGKQLHVYADGEPTAGECFSFEHRCKKIPGEGDEMVQIICAPKLQRQHEAQWTDGKVSITPSILCPDCNTHGFVTDSRWVRA